ncbi:hypothetical protein MWU52_17315 [Jannaschia sp. S6380]|uniref:hypothetical protein n=1 Tax=Jannaschia sp. S6380 TaxID=2926408 RepID=UPI001FF264FD|nr:hypothetical protein [Jannaschia sp. S6380]MCK0169316.1 hypothetical protein [Jannaschia sp. S6380]
MIAGLAAAVLAAMLACVHTFVGGRAIARPLRQATDLPTVVRATSWMCWHMVTTTLFLMAILLFWGAWGGRPDLILAGTLLAAAVALGGLAAAPALGVGYRVLPQGWLFVPVVALGLWSFYA